MLYIKMHKVGVNTESEVLAVITVLGLHEFFWIVC